MTDEAVTMAELALKLAYWESVAGSLEAERDSLVQRLREAEGKLARLAVEGDHHDGSCLQVKQEALAENERLRELIRDVWTHPSVARALIEGAGEERKT